MHEPAHGQKHDGRVRPGGQPGRPAAPEAHEHDGDRDHGEQREDEPELREPDVHGQLVHRRELRRPDEARGVEPERVAGQRDPRPHPVVAVARDVAGVLPRHHRHHGGARGEHGVRDLLQDSRAPVEAEAAQRVGVQHQERQRQRDRDRLRPERPRVEQHRDRPPPAVDWPARPARPDAPEIGEHRGDRQEPAEHVAPPAHPRHRLRAQRVHAPDERGEERAAGDGRGGRHAFERGGDELAREEHEQPRRHRVEQQAREVVAGRRQTPEHVVHAPRDPGHRAPVPEPRRGEHPPEMARAEPAVVGVLEEAHLVVPVHEAGGERGEERVEAHHHGGDGDEARQPELEPAVHRDADSSRSTRAGASRSTRTIVARSSRVSGPSSMARRRSGAASFQRCWSA